MAVKNISTRMKICGRSAKCTGGHSAVEQSGYIGREKMYCEYEGITYYPKFSEDLVHNEVLLPDNAPEEFRDPVKLWNSVEMFEKKDDAQLARTWCIELPNLWTYQFSIMFMRELCERLFVSKGMCVQFAIHDSENTKGQRNLHCHVMLTMRSLDEQGRWMPKQRKVYLTDEHGERIPIIDQKTGEQKVDKQNRKQWKCTTQKVNDWDDQKYAGIWREELTSAINRANADLGMTEDHWEHRSFKERGMDIIPQIHLGEKASAMERAGIRTIRGDINRDIKARNAIIDAARAVYEKAKKDLKAIKAIPIAAIKSFKNEILDMIREVARRNNNRLKLPIIKGKYIGAVSNRTVLQDRAGMEAYVQSKGWASFEEMKIEKKSLEKRYETLRADKADLGNRIEYLNSLLTMYDQYKPYIKYNKEQWALKGWARKKYERSHFVELTYYAVYRQQLKEMIKEDNKKIDPKKWKSELKSLETKYKEAKNSYAGTVIDLAKIEVLNHNKSDLERMLENESHKRPHELAIGKHPAL